MKKSKLNLKPLTEGELDELAKITQRDILKAQARFKRHSQRLTRNLLLANQPTNSQEGA